jgi:hypothetical protein
MGGDVTALVLAYLDPGSGSMIVQLLVGGAAALGVSLRLYWRRILSLLRIRRDEAEASAQQDTRS